MTSLLKAHHAHPLEREYEAWIVHGIEDCLKLLGYKHAIWAVSPNLEATWPADEVLKTPGKLVGLQFKQAKLGSGPISPDRLKWTLNKPPGQFELVQKNTEIFYCLPTFVNRDSRVRALDHCVFWRPDDTVDYNVWYDNPAAATPYKKVRDAMRWGHFLESLLYCQIGKRLDSATAMHSELASFYSKVRESLAAPREGQDNAPSRRANAEPGSTDLALYLLFISF